MECAGRAKRRRRFGLLLDIRCGSQIQSGVALRFATALQIDALRTQRSEGMKQRLLVGSGSGIRHFPYVIFHFSFAIDRASCKV